MSHFARKALGKRPVSTVCHDVNDSLTLQPNQVRPSLRLRIWVRGTAEEIRAGIKGWLPVLLAGTAWDEAQLRTQYKARGICTFWLKVGLEQNAT